MLEIHAGGVSITLSQFRAAFERGWDTAKCKTMTAEICHGPGRLHLWLNQRLSNSSWTAGKHSAQGSTGKQLKLPGLWDTHPQGWLRHHSWGAAMQKVACGSLTAALSRWRLQMEASQRQRVKPALQVGLRFGG